MLHCEYGGSYTPADKSAYTNPSYPTLATTAQALDVLLLYVGADGIDGSAAMPVDDKSTWLKCVNGKFYLNNALTPLSQIVTDAAVMNTLANATNAVAYMIRSTSVIMPAVVGSTVAMTEIGKSSYAMDAIIASPVWQAAILASANAIAGLDASNPVTVPAMTSATTPAGQVATSSVYPGGIYLPWQAFDGDTTTGRARWVTPGVTQPCSEWIQYVFPDPVWVYKARLWPNTESPGIQDPKDSQIQYSDNGATWTDALVYAFPLIAQGSYKEVILTNSRGRHRYWRFYYTTLVGARGTMENSTIQELQYYGK